MSHVIFFGNSEPQTEMIFVDDRITVTLDNSEKKWSIEDILIIALEYLQPGSFQCQFIRNKN